MLCAGALLVVGDWSCGTLTIVLADLLFGFTAYLILVFNLVILLFKLGGVVVCILIALSFWVSFAAFTGCCALVIYLLVYYGCCVVA